jgi:hypothetical protein
LGRLVKRQRSLLELLRLDLNRSHVRVASGGLPDLILAEEEAIHPDWKLYLGKDQVAR